MTASNCFTNTIFLSTLSLRRATLDELCRMMGIKHFYPRSPCGERQIFGHYEYITAAISIHALLAESDPGHDKELKTWQIFLSTLSLRRATSPASVTPTASRNFYPRSPCGERPTNRRPIFNCQTISIHALLAESDQVLQG